jgi:hypothetical protein
MSLPSPEEIQRAEEAAASAGRAELMSPLLQLPTHFTDRRQTPVLGSSSGTLGVKGMLSVERFKRRLKRGEYSLRFSTSTSTVHLTSGLLGRRRGGTRDDKYR